MLRCPGNSESGKTTIFTQIQRTEHVANALPIGGADTVRLCIMSYLKNAIPDAGSAITRPDNDEPTEWRGELGDAVRTTVANAKMRSSFRKHKSHRIGR